MAYMYFFFNSAGLAGGLLYTNLLTPFFYLWLLFKKKQPVLLPFLAILIPFDLVHLYNGVDLKTFLVSNGLFISTYIFVVSFSYFIRYYAQTEVIFRKLLVANFIFTIVACIVYFTPYRPLLWYMNKFTQSVEGFYRLSLLTFEASYYSLLFAPIAIYYLLKVMFKQNTTPAIYILVLVLVPLLLSLSMGVIGAMVISFASLYVLYFKKLFYRKSFFYALFISVSVVIAGFIILAVFFPENPVFIRLYNIFYGIDTSTKGRTSDSFMLAGMVAREKSIWFGAGLGQVKVLAYIIVQKYFNYWGELEVVRIPNAVAETYAIFGIFGLLIRFGTIFYLFFKTKVLGNYYCTALFVFVFVYQFTGSYITNIVEYVIWVLAFSGGFHQFSRIRRGEPDLPNTPQDISTS